MPRRGPGTKGRGTGRWAAGAVIAVAALTGPAVAAQAAANPLEGLLKAGGSQPASGSAARLDLNAQLAQARRDAGPRAVAAATARKAHLRSAGARAERARSKSAFGDLGAASALRLTQQQFGRDLEAVAATSADSLAADRVLGFEDDRTARVDVPGAKEPQLAISTVQPFRVRNDAGRKALVDLGLEATDGGFAPVNPIVDVTLPSSSDGELTVGDDLSLTASIPGGGTTAARRAGDAAVFYPEAGTDTDLVATPTSNGLETFFTLRSAQSPETASLTFDLPRGASLLKQEDGSVNVVRDGKRIGRISAPVAKDAQGTPVATSASVDGDTVTVTTPHRGKDVAYPILVDPIVEIDSLEDPADADNIVDTVTPSAIDLDDLRASPGNTWLRLEGDADKYDTTGTEGAGLYIHDHHLTTSNIGAWVWMPPQRRNHIYDVDFTGIDLSLGGDTSPGAILFAMANPEGNVLDVISADTADDEVELSDEDTDTDSPGEEDLSIVEFGLIRFSSAPPTIPHDYEAFVGGAVMHVQEFMAPEGDGPTFPVFGEGFPADTLWINSSTVESTSFEATSPTAGVKRIEITAQQGSDPEVLLGSVEAPCASDPLEACPTTLDDAFDVDWGLMVDEGLYTLRLRGYDGDDEATTITFHLGVDRTAPDLDLLTGDLAALDGLTTASTSTLTLTVPASEVGDDLTKSGLGSVGVYDSMSEYAASRDCAVDDCDDQDYEVDLSTLSEGVHTISAEVYDRAGNQATEHITFTIDRP